MAVSRYKSSLGSIVICSVITPPRIQEHNIQLSSFSHRLSFASNTRKAMDMSKIQITRFTSALMFFIFTGGVFFNSVGATRIPGHHSQCNTGPVQCCHQSFDSNSHEAKNLLALNNIGLGVLSGVTGMVGAECTPITALGVGSGGNWWVLL